MSSRIPGPLPGATPPKHKMRSQSQDNLISSAGTVAKCIQRHGIFQEIPGRDRTINNRFYKGRTVTEQTAQTSDIPSSIQPKTPL